MTLSLKYKTENNCSVKLLLPTAVREGRCRRRKGFQFYVIEGILRRGNPPIAQNLMYRLTGKLYPVYLPETTDPLFILAEPEANEVLTVKEELKNNNIQVFPNPNNGKFLIEFKDIVAHQLVVYSLEGKKVFESNIGEQIQIEVQLPKNLSGMFQLIIYGDDNEIIHSEKLIINE